MLVSNQICELLNIKYPIIQGGMAWVATAELAAAVSNAGGLGLIGAGHMPPDALRKEIRRAKELTTKVFGVNVMLMSPFVKEVMQVVVDEKVQVVTTGAGNPGEYIPALKGIGARIIPVVASVALAKRLERIGVDALVAEGHESGGHVGEVSTMALVPQVVDAVSIPVIAAGGIADSRGVVAALALGAQGVQIGTRFVATTECLVHERYKQALVKAKERSTIVTGVSTGHPVRVLQNKLTKEYVERERAGATTEELDQMGAGKLRLAAQEGDVDYGSVMVGQIAGMIREIQSVEAVMQDLVSGIPGVMEHLQQATRFKA
ncbi:enoyl-[acyl-carrier-protein] reductase FabK [Anaeromusa sp.]|uniref:enoyl-[acyl-carrier-protein] reductase FabK n=1 Tax=Anaeromusa sp. TaxID=1872520 RepID=UPI00261697A8|nr:enoyl-[acyl-carrier-protein] reductase FabK [Anaeromusa sp.]MDD3158280.1 enoyl-[acyl-carrier-protein] reductase FabK [Anaeromusa sp.]MEA4833642.1 enoyl-[acyl-carrier-protein] reductase FabK [Anaeromusa sp.]